MVVLWCCGARNLKSEDRFPAGPRALLRWFPSGRNRLGRMKKVWYMLAAYFDIIQEHFF